MNLSIKKGYLLTLHTLTEEEYYKAEAAFKKDKKAFLPVIEEVLLSNVVGFTKVNYDKDGFPDFSLEVWNIVKQPNKPARKTACENHPERFFTYMANDRNRWGVPKEILGGYGMTELPVGLYTSVHSQIKGVFTMLGKPKFVMITKKKL